MDTAIAAAWWATHDELAPQPSEGTGEAPTGDTTAAHTSSSTPPALLRRSDYREWVWRPLLLPPAPEPSPQPEGTPTGDAQTTTTTTTSPVKPSCNGFTFELRYSPGHWGAKRGGMHNPKPVSVVPPPRPAGGFDFTKAKPGEVMAEVSTATGELLRTKGSPGHTGFPGFPAGGGEGATAAAAPTFLLFNVSPMFLCHSLLVPRPPLRLPQVLSAVDLLLAVRFIQGSTSNARLVYNSMGAFASVPHLHFHYLMLEGGSDGGGDENPSAAHPRAVHTAAACGRDFPIEKCGRVPCGAAGAGAAPCVSDLQGYPVRAFCCELPEVRGGGGVSEERLVGFFETLVAALHSHAGEGVPYNLLVAPRRLYVVPRQNQAHNTGSFRVAVVEAMGCPVASSEEHFHSATAEGFDAAMRQEVSLPDALYEELLSKVLQPEGGRGGA